MNKTLVILILILLMCDADFSEIPCCTVTEDGDYELIECWGYPEE